MKNALVVIVILALLGVGGYFFLSSRGSLPKVPGMMTGQDSGSNVFTSIKDALSKSLSLKCVYTGEGGVETTTYIKAGAVRVMMAGNANAEQPNNIIMKDKRMHMWSDSSKTGFVFTIEEPQNVTPFPTVEDAMESEDKSGTDQQESILAQIEKYKDACRPEVIADSMFAVPTDVEFQDMNALQEQMMQQLPTTPSGAEGNVDFNQLMQQYGQ